MVGDHERDPLDRNWMVSRRRARVGGRSHVIGLVLVLAGWMFGAAAWASFPASGGGTALQYRSWPPQCTPEATGCATPWQPTGQAACDAAVVAAKSVYTTATIAATYKVNSGGLGTNNGTCFFTYNGSPWANNAAEAQYQSVAYSCPANATLTGSSCSCNTNYELNQATGNSCSKMDETNQTQAPVCLRCLFGYPIDPVLGSEIWYERTGVKLRGGALLLTYDSVSGQRPASANNITSLVEPNGFGKYWHSSFHHKLQVSVSKKTALVSRGDGQVLSFTGDGAGNFTASGYNNAVLTTVPGGYRFTDINSGAIENFSATGQLQSIAGIDGSVLTFIYAGANLVGVTDGDGRSVRFSYTNNLISRIVGPDGQAIAVAYDTNGNLATLTWADTKVRKFVYEDVTLPWALTGVVDENGARHATIAYDPAGRAVSEELGGGVNRYSVSYSSGPRWLVSDTYDSQTDTITRVHSWEAPTGTSVTTPNGQTLGIDVQSLFGMPVPASVAQPAGSGSPAAATATTFDAAGNVSSRDDASGTRTCSLYDSRNRETVRVEGLANTVACSTVTDATGPLPAGARRITRTWHLDWKLPTQVVEALRKTTYVYHGQPDPFNGNATANCSAIAALPDGKPVPLLCRQVTQATLPDGTPDPAVQASSMSYTYDPAGRLLTERDAMGHATTYSRYVDALNVRDPFFDQVTLLLHGDGANGSGAVVDSSGTARTMTRGGGGAAISTGQSKFGGSSIYFDGVDDYLSTPLDSGFKLSAASGATIELFFNLVGNSVQDGSGMRRAGLLGSFQSGQTGGFDILIDGDANNTGTGGIFVEWITAAGTTQSKRANTPAISKNVWHHLAVSISQTGTLFYLDGVPYSAGGITLNLDAPGTGNFYVGKTGTNTPWDRPFNGYIDDLRITNGIARYASGFTVPTQAYPSAVPSGAAGHAVGDVQSVTDAAAHVTQFPLLELGGRVRQVINPKGVVTDITYTPRGLPNTVTMTPPGGAPRTTTYTHDAAGQLTGVALPDGTTLGYSYDAAHRLVGVTDARGNSVTYTLDNSGNRIQEEVADPSGALRRSIRRSFDALNRLQQVTGGAQ